ncbi:MAG: dihydroneopterin aldolase [Actinobacteria bacterium]|nr:dihydroneopterin aldolase [Actinomycetota bacterium]MBU1942308.1 dihydroneopterin aldolase [Actinomycetota bacterium]MBU2686389.1 dihydroneopterin aldolase [Actinomycetota bacterium]
METVLVEGISVFAYHGVTPEEKRNGQDFLIDLEIDLERDDTSDDVTTTLDYSRVAEGVAGVVTGERCELIETVAGRVLDHLLSYPVVRRATVTIYKPDAPMPLEVAHVGVRVTRERAGGAEGTGR